MRTITSAKAYYPQFSIGWEPVAVECELRIMEANDKRYLVTPFAILNAYSDDEIERQFLAGQYYRTAQDCEAYLAAQYPHWKEAQPIMEEWCNRREYGNQMSADHSLCDDLGISIFDVLPKLARGHRSFTLKMIRKACRTIREKQVAAE